MDPTPTPLADAAASALADWSAFMAYVGGPEGLAMLVAAVALVAGLVVGLALTGGTR